jgi:histidyl-tRNA synthetase
MPTFQTVRGMRDLLPEDAAALNRVIAKARETAALYGYKEVITPVVEPYELLSAKSGEEIRQRMFTFKDLGDRTVALRPEFTASIARLATTALRNEPKPLRTFSVGSVYRYDEPQRGRYREFWQSDFEVIGSSKPEADAEIILLTNSLMQAVGLRNYAFKLGHIGVLRGILSQENVDDKTQNAVLQRMDKKEYAEAFALMPQKCRVILEGLLKLKSGDAFETVEKIALGGGGRYDRLIEAFGGEATPATGVAHGLDRIALAIQTQKLAPKNKQTKRVVVIPVKEELKGDALRIAQMLRTAGLPVEFEVMGRKMAKALEDADKRQVDYVVIVGEKELQQNAVVLRNLSKREQTVVAISSLAEKIRS